MKSNLKMNNLYFSSCSVERACKVENGECKADLQRNITKTDEHEYDVELIMFPFIRSQVTLLTTQPGMTPIVLPPINTTKFE